MSKKLSKETLKRIREEIKDGKSKYQTAAEFGLHPTVVYRWTQDLPGGQYGWPGIRGKTLEILQELIKHGYVLGSHFNAGHKYRILRKYFPNICKISMYNKTVLYLDDKAPVAARAFLSDMNKKIISFQELKQVTKTFNVDLKQSEKKAFTGRNRQRIQKKKLSTPSKSRAILKETQSKIDDFLGRILHSEVLSAFLFNYLFSC